MIIALVIVEKANSRPLHSPQVSGALPPQDVGGEQAHWSPLLPPANPRTRRFVR